MAQGYETTIGPRTRLRARVHGDGDVALEGHIEGNVSLGGKLTVHEGGVVKGETSASELVVAGELEGPVRSEGALVVSASGNRLYAWEARSRTMSVVDAASGRVIHESRIPNAVQLQFTAPVDGDMLLMGADGRVESLAPSRRPAPAAPAAPATSAVEASTSASAAPSR